MYSWYHCGAPSLQVKASIEQFKVESLLKAFLPESSNNNTKLYQTITTLAETKLYPMIKTLIEKLE